MPLQPGWTELPPAPYSPALRDPIVFWADGELIVPGSYEFPEPYAELTMRTDSYAYSMASGQWRELAPLEIPGYAGVIGAAGTWTGSAWEGLALSRPVGSRTR
ncbi:MAG: hypothetical protein H0U15_05005 [Geodermatophilaceae bacterium]|nr:hypothetical protein [Geodermatophilaceae bacterium]